MKKCTVALSFFVLLFSQQTFANSSSLFVIDGDDLIDIQTLIDEEDDVGTFYGFDDFCYKGMADVVANKMELWSKNTDYFFSGGGGSFILIATKIIRGFVTYDIEMTLEDEVVPGEFKKVYIKPCK